MVLPLVAQDKQLEGIALSTNTVASSLPTTSSVNQFGKIQVSAVSAVVEPVEKVRRVRMV